MLMNIEYQRIYIVALPTGRRTNFSDKKMSSLLLKQKTAKVTKYFLANESSCWLQFMSYVMRFVMLIFYDHTIFLFTL